MREPVDFKLKRNYESMLNKEMSRTSKEKSSIVVKKPVAKPVIVHKPIYKSIMAITAAIVLQNYWRDYRNRKINNTSDGKNVLELLKSKFENNTTILHDKSSSHLVSKSMMETGGQEIKEEPVQDFILEDIRDQVEDSPEQLSQSIDDQVVDDSVPSRMSIPENKAQIKKEIDRPEAPESHRTDNFSMKDPEEIMKHNELEKIFEMQEKAISFKESTQKAIMHKMLKQQKVSPNTYHKKKHSLEMWVTTEREKLDKQKSDFKNVFQNTIEIINNTKKNKEHIKKILNRSKSKRPGIWSDYSDSFYSCNSKKSCQKQTNVSMRIDKLGGFAVGSSDSSLNSLIFSNEHQNLDNSVNSKSSILLNFKNTLKAKLNDFAVKSNQKMVKEFEYKNSKTEEIKTTEVVEKIEIVPRDTPDHTTVHDHEEQAQAAIIEYTPEDPPSNFTITPDGKTPNIVDYMNKNYESSQDSRIEKAKYFKFEETLDKKIQDLESPTSSCSPEIPQDHFEQSQSDVDKSGALQISAKKSEPIQKTNAIDEINIQSKWLEGYLKRDKQQKDTEAEEVPVAGTAPSQILYDDDDAEGEQERHSIKFIEEDTYGETMQITPESDNSNSSKCGEGEQHDVPVISYSEDDQSFKENMANDGEDFEIVSESDTQIKNNDLITQTAPNVENEMLEQERHTDLVTNDLFYEILAEIITEPIPRRDLSNFNIPQNVSNRKLIHHEKRKGFELLAVEKYLEEVIETIMENESGFIDNLLEPVRRNPLDMLQLLQNSDLGSYEHFDNVSLKQPVLNLDLYLDIERVKEEKRLTEKANQNIVKTIDTEASVDDDEQIEFEQIHRKMIFDGINESINKYRPYGEEGVPMPWSSSTRRLCSNDILNFEKVFNGIKDNLFRWGTSQVGVMPSIDYCLGNEFDEDFFAEVREKRLAELLSNEVHGSENKWLKYEFEEAQVKIDITDMILEDMIEEI